MMMMMISVIIILIVIVIVIVIIITITIIIIIITMIIKRYFTEGSDGGNIMGKFVIIWPGEGRVADK